MLHKLLEENTRTEQTFLWHRWQHRMCFLPWHYNIHSECWRQSCLCRIHTNEEWFLPDEDERKNICGRHLKNNLYNFGSHWSTRNWWWSKYEMLMTTMDVSTKLTEWPQYLALITLWVRWAINWRFHNCSNKICNYYHWILFICRVRVVVFNATFKNISVTSWQSVLLVEEARVPKANHRPVTSHGFMFYCLSMV